MHRLPTTEAELSKYVERIDRAGREVAYEALLRVSERDPKPGKALLPFGIVDAMLEPLTLWIESESAFIESEAITELGKRVAAYWNRLPKQKRGAKRPNPAALKAKFGSPEWQVVDAMWPLVRYLVAVLDVRGNNQLAPAARDAEERRLKALMVHHLVLAGAALVLNPEEMHKRIKRIVRKYASDRHVDWDEVPGLVNDVYVMLETNGLRRLTVFDPTIDGSLQKYWGSMIFRFAADARRKACRKTRPVDPERVARRAHQDPTRSTMTVAELARAKGRPESSVRLALARVERELKRKAPRCGRFARLDREWCRLVIAAMGTPRASASRRLRSKRCARQQTSDRRRVDS